MRVLIHRSTVCGVMRPELASGWFAPELPWLTECWKSFASAFGKTNTEFFPSLSSLWNVRYFSRFGVVTGCNRVLRTSWMSCDQYARRVALELWIRLLPSLAEHALRDTRKTRRS